jgi:hypothetical protein
MYQISTSNIQHANDAIIAINTLNTLYQIITEFFFVTTCRKSMKGKKTTNFNGLLFNMGNSGHNIEFSLTKLYKVNELHYQDQLPTHNTLHQSA